VPIEKEIKLNEYGFFESIKLRRRFRPSTATQERDSPESCEATLWQAVLGCRWGNGPLDTYASLKVARMKMCSLLPLPARSLICEFDGRK